MEIILREYQENAVSKLRQGIIKGLRRFILCAPTGSGKTVIFSYMAKRATEKGKKVLIVTDRIELLTQAGGTLSNFGLHPIEIKAGKKLKSLNGILYVAMAQTLSRRLKKSEYQEFYKDLDLIIYDEAHKQSHNSLMPFVSDKTTVIGATATPHRESNQKSLHEFYQQIVEVTDINELVSQGYLARPESYGVEVDLSEIKTKGKDYDSKAMGDKYDEIELYHGVYDNYMRICPNQKAIIFAPNIASSKTLVSDFKSKGLPIEHIDGETPKGERKRILKWFNETPTAMISNVGILNAGFDVPSIEVVILYRATKSLPLFLQMVGRGSRTTKTKKEFKILDFGNNIKRHGFWEQKRVWSLKRKKKKEGAAPIKDCPSCFAMLSASVMECEYCGHIFEKTEKDKKEEVIAELRKLSGKEIQERAKTADFDELHVIQQSKGYSRGWVYHQLRTKEHLEQYASHMGYKSGWVKYQLEKRQKEAETNNV